MVGWGNRRLVTYRDQHDAEWPDHQPALPAVAGDCESGVLPWRRGIAPECQRRSASPDRSAHNRQLFQQEQCYDSDRGSALGNAGRNIARSNAYFQFDFGLQKNFRLPVNEVSKVEFRMEAFNVFNKTNFGAANSDRSSAAFGTIRSTFSARQVQLALKLSF